MYSYIFNAILIFMQFYVFNINKISKEKDEVEKEIEVILCGWSKKFLTFEESI